MGNVQASQESHRLSITDIYTSRSAGSERENLDGNDVQILEEASATLEEKHTHLSRQRGGKYFENENFIDNIKKHFMKG
ncbi:hypothetical protein TNCV_2501901 [Trichonephila clavipes]|nr:hypothetical protein TNCV_2501901 [Trichonephila clavipes]